MPLCIPHWHGHGKFTDGFLHWEVSREGIGEDARAISKFIISFDLVAEKFQELLPLPPYHDDETGNKKFASFRTFTILGGFPSIVWHDSLIYVVEVWVMKEFGCKDSWIKLLTSECQRPHPASMYQLLPLCFLKNNEILMGWSGIKLVIYNMIEETFRTLKVPYFWFPYRMVLYGESLVSPNCNGKKKKMKNREERYLMDSHSGWDL
ncbi:hypothetical protein L1049_016626 [Liquidambar formosana]|uniref:F-box associated beta-propeller type 1 domain-containing protein n=1 Tax=Liquidambar formosana TaxID=63359 RepID=A0AAP0S059_LIQFO